MNKYFWILIILILLVSVVLIFIGFSTKVVENNIPEVSLTDISSNLNPPNFIKTGNIVSTGANGWKLAYEEPGKPALTALLVFNFSSKCMEDKIVFDCSLKKFENGTRVAINGYQESEGGVVNIYNLTIKK